MDQWGLDRDFFGVANIGILYPFSPYPLNFGQMQEYQVSARKYRPPRFEELVGQGHITTTLRNAIDKGQLAQAYLFCGPRGVGKTSCARILAKTINCSFRDNQQEACGACPSCLSIDQGRSLAIHELDAASNNSVDDIRSLVEQVRYPPQGNDFKVYIIDEVHMLSTAAFNALLKTLEEPPPYAKFILATTEKHKILPTILSRCQVFDFKRIRLQDIADRLATVCRAEGINFEPDALLTIASRSDGALRDALTMLDQLAGFSGGKLTNALVCDQLGVLDKGLFVECARTMSTGDPSWTLQALDDMIARGYDSILWVLGMASHFRNILMAKTPGTTELIDSGQEYRDQLQEQSRNMTTDILLAGLHLLSQAELQYRQSRQPRLLVETAVMKICYLAQRNTQKSAAPTPASQQTERAKEEHPLQGITSRIPSADLKTPAQVKIQVKISEEQTLQRQHLIKAASETYSASPSEPYSETQTELQKPVLGPIPPSRIGEPLPIPAHVNESAEVLTSGPVNATARGTAEKPASATATTVDFLEKLRGHLSHSASPVEANSKEASHPWSPPPPSVGQNLQSLWQHLINECQSRNLGGLVGILSRNLPQPVGGQPNVKGVSQTGDESDIKSQDETFVLPILLYSDTEKSLFDAEKQGILDFLMEFGNFQSRPRWVIQQQENNAQREKFLTEPERFNILSTENENFKDLSARLKLFLI